MAKFGNNVSLKEQKSVLIIVENNFKIKKFAHILLKNY